MWLKKSKKLEEEVGSQKKKKSEVRRDGSQRSKKKKSEVRRDRSQRSKKKKSEVEEEVRSPIEEVKEVRRRSQKKNK